MIAKLRTSLRTSPELIIPALLPLFVVVLVLSLNHLWGYVVFAGACWTLPRALRADRAEREMRMLTAAWNAASWNVDA